MDMPTSFIWITILFEKALVRNFEIMLEQTCVFCNFVKCRNLASCLSSAIYERNAGDKLFPDLIVIFCSHQTKKKKVSNKHEVAK
jgi:hypothetical protein